VGELYLVFLFVKQETARDIGTGDWSSDVCSSYLKTQGVSLPAELLKNAINVDIDAETK